MPTDRRDLISDLYHRALARAPSERASFVAEACNGDERLCQEVESLLEFESVSARFLENLAVIRVRSKRHVDGEPADRVVHRSWHRSAPAAWARSTLAPLRSGAFCAPLPPPVTRSSPWCGDARAPVDCLQDSLRSSGPGAAQVSPELSAPARAEVIGRQIHDDLNLSTTALTKEEAVHSRTPVLLGFVVELPPCHRGSVGGG